MLKRCNSISNALELSLSISYWQMLHPYSSSLSWRPAEQGSTYKKIFTCPNSKIQHYSIQNHIWFEENFVQIINIIFVTLKLLVQCLPSFGFHALWVEIRCLLSFLQLFTSLLIRSWKCIQKFWIYFHSQGIWLQIKKIIYTAVISNLASWFPMKFNWCLSGDLTDQSCTKPKFVAKILTNFGVIFL